MHVFMVMHSTYVNLELTAVKLVDFKTHILYFTSIKFFNLIAYTHDINIFLRDIFSLCL